MGQRVMSKYFNLNTLVFLMTLVALDRRPQIRYRTALALLILLALTAPPVLAQELQAEVMALA